jgi:hypothetical protein
MTRAAQMYLFVVGMYFVLAILFSPVMLPAASIMVLPGPSFYIVADMVLTAESDGF